MQISKFSKCIRFWSETFNTFLYKCQEMYKPNNLTLRLSGEINYFDLNIFLINPLLPDGTYKYQKTLKYI